MKEKASIARNTSNNTSSGVLFDKGNYMWMIVGAAVIALGMLLMTGGKNPPNEFDTSVVYSTTRITVAPLLILAGFVIEIYAIFKRPKTA